MSSTNFEYKGKKVEIEHGAVVCSVRIDGRLLALSYGVLRAKDRAKQLIDAQERSTVGSLQKRNESGYVKQK